MSETPSLEGRATIELEMVAICWATFKCKIFLSGLQHFVVITDHNPCYRSSTLIAWMRSRIPDYSDLEPTIYKLMAYNFTVEWFFILYY